MVQGWYFRRCATAPELGGSAGPGADGEGPREKALRLLGATLQEFENATLGLTAEQWRFRPGADAWSIAECAEHLVLVERSILAKIEAVLQLPPESRPGDPVRIDDRVLRVVAMRERKVTAPDAMQPKGAGAASADSSAEAAEGAQAFRAVRLQTMEFARKTTADLRAHSSPHFVLGRLDVCQWLLFLAAHTRRHLRQLEEIRAQGGFPG